MSSKSKWLARLSDTTTIIEVAGVKLEIAYEEYRLHAVNTWTDDPPEDNYRTQGILKYLDEPSKGGIIVPDVKHFIKAIKQARAIARHDVEAVYLEYHPAQPALTVRTRETERGTVNASIPAYPIGSSRFIQVMLNARYLLDALTGLSGAIEIHVTAHRVFITQWGWSNVQFAAIAAMVDGHKPPAPLITNEPAPCLKQPIKSKPIRLFKREKPQPQPVPDYVKTVEFVVSRKPYKWGRKQYYDIALRLVGVCDGK